MSCNCCLAPYPHVQFYVALWILFSLVEFAILCLLTRYFFYYMLCIQKLKCCNYFVSHVVWVEEQFQKPDGMLLFSNSTPNYNLQNKDNVFISIQLDRKRPKQTHWQNTGEYLSGLFCLSTSNLEDLPLFFNIGFLLFLIII